nr:uncharacterized protein LOC129388221 isoform X2 [Dermacentor andersoni]
MSWKATDGRAASAHPGSADLLFVAQGCTTVAVTEWSLGRLEKSGRKSGRRPFHDLGSADLGSWLRETRPSQVQRWVRRTGISLSSGSANVWGTLNAGFISAAGRSGMAQSSGSPHVWGVLNASFISTVGPPGIALPSGSAHVRGVLNASFISTVGPPGIALPSGSVHVRGALTPASPPPQWL